MGEIYMHWQRNQIYHQIIQGHKHKDHVYHKQYIWKTPHHRAENPPMQIRQKWSVPIDVP